MSGADAYARTFVRDVQGSLAPHADSVRAVAMRAYMKDVAPFLGIGAPIRRSALRPLLRALQPGADDVVPTVRALWGLHEREYQYVACDFLAQHEKLLSASFLRTDLEFLLTTRAWWDTVDALGTAVVTPLVARHPQLVSDMWRWLAGDNIWLVRAAIQHQRGLKHATDVERLVGMCSQRAADREFFIAKAVGWTLRDLAHLNRPAALAFGAAHDELSPVAARELARGLAATESPPKPGARAKSAAT